MCKQIDGVVMGSPLGPALANIFVKYHEEKLFTDNNQECIGGGSGGIAVHLLFLENA